MRCRVTFILMVVAFLSMSASVAWAAPSKPSLIIKSFYATLLDTMKQGETLGFDGRAKKLEAPIKASFNLPLMTRFAVGSIWVTATVEEQKQLVTAFSDFSVATYASRFAAYDGENFAVVGEKTVADGVIVETTLTPKESDPVALNYLMKKDEQGAWRIVDVLVNGAVSELATRRAEFGSIARRDGIAALVNALGEKSKQLGPS